MRHVRQSPSLQKGEALATSKKIDAIESEISAEYAHASGIRTASALSPANGQPSLSQCLDEAALLFANRESEAARNLLLQAISLTGEDNERRQAWWMLFELALATNQPEFFETLALDYALAFETSPPQWQAARTANTLPSRATLPIVNFRGKLCGSSLPALLQLQALGLRHQQFCLQISLVTEIDLDGCEALLQVLGQWQEASCGFVISGGEKLIEALRPLIQAGRRDSNDAGWRLTIEWLRLLNRSEDYEALCLDYCLTYEVSPPAASPQHKALASAAWSFTMPQSITLPIDRLLLEIEDYCRQTPALILDCRPLAHIEFSAAVPWLSGVLRIAAGKAVECRDTSFLVSRLLHLVGGKHQLNLINRKR